MKARAVSPIAADSVDAFVPREIRRILKRDVPLVARVNDGEVSAEIRSLERDTRAAPFWKERTSGWRRIQLGQDMEVDFMPKRAGVPAAKTPGDDGCALCRLPKDEGRQLAWGDLKVGPNLFPYSRPEGVHLLVTSLLHGPQTFAIERVGEVLKLQRLLGPKAPRTLFFNGNAGNSQFHWHWHLTDEQFPLERALQEKRLGLTRLRKTPQVEISTFSRGLMKGFLVVGEEPAVARWAQEITSRIERDPRCQGRYNLLLLPRAQGRARLVIFPRSAPPEGEKAFGALMYAGRLIVPKESVDQEVLHKAVEDAGRQIVDPNAFEWLGDLKRAPEPPILALRAAGPLLDFESPKKKRVVVDPQGEFILPEALSPGGVRLPTVSVPGTKLSFIVLGDSGKGTSEQMEHAPHIVEAAKARGAHFALHTGDIIYPHGIDSADDPKLKTHLLEPYAELPQIYLSLGNHDWANGEGAGDPDAFIEAAARHKQLVMPARYYQFGYAFGGRRADFFVLDTSVLASDDAQRAWLSKALKASTADWKIVVGHHPLYSYGLHGGQEHIRRLLLPELTDRADLYVGGHEHDQQVLENDSGILFLVSGAAGEKRKTGQGQETNFAVGDQLGFMSVEIGADGLHVDVHGQQGELLYRESRPPKPNLSPRANASFKSPVSASVP